MLTKTKRPKYLNLFKIRQPVMAVVSIFHRVSGVILFLAIPVLIYWLALSVRSAEDYAAASAFFASPWVQLICLVLAWALAHHFFTGIRYLLMDISIGENLPAARISAWLVFGIVAVVMLIVIGAMWL
jgi:succinate dehydrogenase / fumarate reductase, cytochrome b subunit